MASPWAEDEREAFAVREGFNSFAPLLTFWDGRLPFNGDIIHWKYPGVQA